MVDVQYRRTHDLLLILCILRNYAFISFISQWEVKLSYYRVGVYSVMVFTEALFILFVEWKARRNVGVAHSISRNGQES